MSVCLASIGDLYQEGIVDTGREAQFLCTAAFLLSFGFIRTSAHLIRAQVSWWPGNVEVGGTHIHHLVWGICALLFFGYVGVGLDPESPWREIVAVFFGIGMGLTLDEFALWLNLRDVYWEKEGRRSIDAVMVAAGIAALLFVGFRGWIDAADSVENEVFAFTGTAGLLGILIVLINASKEKFGMALAGLLLLPVGLVAAFRLGKPHSVWAKVFYHHGQLDRSKHRFTGSRAKPFWKRGGDLLGRLRPGGSGRSAQN